jgi:hypothetical protein
MCLDEVIRNFKGFEGLVLNFRDQFAIFDKN